MKSVLRFTFLISLLWISVQKCEAQEPDSLNVDSTIEHLKDKIEPNSSILKDSTLAVDSLTVDSTKSDKVRFKLIKSILDKKYPNPNRAAAMSFILPGSGQIYNKKYWKLPFVYGALGGLGYMAYFNNKQYNTYKQAYLFQVDDDLTTINPFSSLNEGGLLRQRDKFNKRRQQGYIFFVAAWALNAVDAYVDAHLTSFDVNEDISMHFNPVGIQVANSSAYGLSVHFTHRTKEDSSPLFQY